MNVSETSPTESHALRLAESLRSRNTFEVVLESLIYGSICTSGVVGNSLVLYIVYKFKKLRTVPGLLIASLALSDIAIFCLVTPPSLVSLIKGRWTAGFVVCQFQGFVVITTVAASLQTMALMSVDRYFRVVHPIRHRTFFTMPRVRLMVASVWVIALMYPVPYLASGRKYIYHPGKFFCFHEEKSSFEADVIYICICSSFTVISFCYYNVFRRLRLNAKRWRENDDNARRISSEETTLTRTLFAIVIGYLICWTPVLIIDLMERGVGEWSFPRWVYIVYNDFGLTSSCLNPIIYGAFNKTFRQEYKKIFCPRNSSNSVSLDTESQLSGVDSCQDKHRRDERLGDALPRPQQHSSTKDKDFVSKITL